GTVRGRVDLEQHTRGRHPTVRAGSEPDWFGRGGTVGVQVGPHTPTPTSVRIAPSFTVSGMSYRTTYPHSRRPSNRTSTGSSRSMRGSGACSTGITRDGRNESARIFAPADLACRASGISGDDQNRVTVP